MPRDAFRSDDDYVDYILHMNQVRPEMKPAIDASLRAWLARQRS